MKDYYLMDVRAWIAKDNNQSIEDCNAIVYTIEHNLKDAEKELLNSFNDAMIVDKDFNYVHSDQYKQFEAFRYSIRRNHFIGRDPILDKKEGTDNIDVLNINDVLTDEEIDKIEKEAQQKVSNDVPF